MKTKLLPQVIVVGAAAFWGIYFVWIADAGQTSSPSDQDHAAIAKSADGSALKAVSESYGEIEMAFEENKGQTDPSVGFLARGSGYTLFLKPDEAVFSLSRPERDEKSSDEMPVGPDRNLATRDAGDPKPGLARSKPSSVLRMKILGANKAAEASRADELAGKANYLIGNDPAKWQTNVSTYGRVRYSGVYKGIDVEYYGNQRRLEYDFRVEPGADHRQIALKFEGSESVKIEPETGDLLIAVDGQIVRQNKPFVYQEFDGERREIDSRFAIGRGERIGFEIGEYDAAKTLVIDPVLVYSSFLGGSGTDAGYGIAVDSAGNAYITGSTNSANFPTVNPIQAAASGDPFYSDVFVTMINTAGSAVVYSTYLGGGAIDVGRGIAVDAAGNAYITGNTVSPNFPTAAAMRSTGGGNGNTEGFLAKLNASGSSLVYSTYLGGTSHDFPDTITLDSSGSIFVVGNTLSSDFPVTANPLQATRSGDWDLFITKVNAAGSALLYSTYLGGTRYDYAGGIAVDGSGNAYVTGSTASPFPLLNAAQPNFGGNTDDGFVAKINSAGSALVYSTYLGGNDSESGAGIAVDPAGNAYITGSTRSTNFPTVNPIQGPTAGIGSVTDAFVTKLNPDGSAFVYSTYLGGTNGDVGSGIALDQNGNVYLAGTTGSANFPIVPANPGGYGGGADAFVAKINSAGSALLYSTFLGGTAHDQGHGIALDPAGNAYMTGEAAGSSNFPTVNQIPGASGSGGLTDAFVAKIAEGAGPLPTPQPTPTPTPAPTPIPPAYLGQLVISQVYGGGGLAGATYRNSYVEIFNRNSSPILTNAYSIALGLGVNPVDRSYGAASSQGIVIQPGQYILMKMGSGGGSGAELPQPDLEFLPPPPAPSSYFGLSGKLSLLGQTADNSRFGDCPLTAQSLSDFVGFGATNCFEGSGPITGLSVTKAAFRKNNGCTDTNDNANDFAVGTPNPRNSSSPYSSCAPTPTIIPVAISGRVVRGSSALKTPATIVLTDTENSARYVARTNGLGYFNIPNVLTHQGTGKNFRLDVENKSFRFAGQTISINSNVIGLTINAP